MNFEDRVMLEPLSAVSFGVAANDDFEFAGFVIPPFFFNCLLETFRSNFEIIVVSLSFCDFEISNFEKGACLFILVTSGLKTGRSFLNGPYLFGLLSLVNRKKNYATKQICII